MVLRGLHDGFDRLGKALVFLFHLAQQVDAVFHRAHIHGQAHFLVLCLLGALPAAVHFQAVAFNDVAHGLRFLAGVIERAAVGAGLPGGLVQLRLRLRHIALQRAAPLRHLVL